MFRSPKNLRSARRTARKIEPRRLFLEELDYCYL